MKEKPPQKRYRLKLLHYIDFRWVFTIFFGTIFISGTISLLSSGLLNSAGLGVAYVILFAIILIGIVFDVVGVSVTAADPSPFHSMAAKKRPEGKEALKLISNADRVSSFCNDVVGDICGVISGSASAVIAARTIVDFEPMAASFVQLLMSALVAAFTVGGKAVGKGFAMSASKDIVLITATILYRVKALFRFRKKR